MSISENTPQRLNTAEAADYIGVVPGTLEVWRCSRRYDLPYIKVGRRVFYLRADLDNWLQSRRIGGQAA